MSDQYEQRGYSALVNLIVHAKQSQPIGWSSRTRTGAIKTPECGRYAIRCSLPSTHFDQRSDNRPHHIAQEAIRRSNNRYLVRVSPDVKINKRANMVFSIRACDRESGEVVRAKKRGGRPLHLLDLKAGAIMMDIAIDERADHITGPYAIPIGLSRSRMASVERIRDRQDFQNSNIPLEIAVDSVTEQGGFEASLNKEICYLAFGMYARVGASRTVNGDRAMVKNRKYFREFTLNRTAVRLHLPAVIVRAVILDRDLEVLHA